MQSACNWMALHALICQNPFLSKDPHHGRHGVQLLCAQYCNSAEEMPMIFFSFPYILHISSSSPSRSVSLPSP